MSTEQAPLCTRHKEERRMLLRSLHSDASRPEQVVGLYECPECGYERRIPVEPAA